ncbi:MAG: hypothetical protein MHM6MM_005396 [Cercozoa sp. M6MM]
MSDYEEDNEELELELSDTTLVLHEVAEDEYTELQLADFASWGDVLRHRISQGAKLRLTMPLYTEDNKPLKLTDKPLPSADQGIVRVVSDEFTVSINHLGKQDTSQVHPGMRLGEVLAAIESSTGVHIKTVSKGEMVLHRDTLFGLIIQQFGHSLAEFLPPPEASAPDAPENLQYEKPLQFECSGQVMVLITMFPDASPDLRRSITLEVSGTTKVRELIERFEHEIKHYPTGALLERAKLVEELNRNNVFDDNREVAQIPAPTQDAVRLVYQMPPFHVIVDGQEVQVSDSVTLREFERAYNESGARTIGPNDRVFCDQKELDREKPFWEQRVRPGARLVIERHDNVQSVEYLCGQCGSIQKYRTDAPIACLTVGCHHSVLLKVRKNFSQYNCR